MCQTVEYEAGDTGCPKNKLKIFTSKINQKATIYDIYMYLCKTIEFYDIILESSSFITWFVCQTTQNFS